MEGTFVLDPHPAGIFMQDACLTRLPPPGISVIFQLCWVPPGRIFPSKMPLHYTLMRKPVIVSTLKREKISIFMLMQCQVISNNNFFALQSDAISQTNELQLLPRAVARFFVTGGGGIIPSAEGISLVGGVGVSSPRQFSNMEAPKRYFQHLS